MVSNRIVVSQPVLQLYGCDLQQTGSFKYLGICVDRTMKFNTQTDLISSILSSLCGITY